MLAREATKADIQAVRDRLREAKEQRHSNIQNGVPIAIILQYGHGTRNGGWVQGRDYINPAIQPIFDKIANEAWKEVTKLWVKLSTKES